MTTKTFYDVNLCAGKHLFHLPDGRVMHVWIPDPETLGHACVDIWTTRGRDNELASQYTGDKTRASMGMFAWSMGHRRTVEQGLGDGPGCAFAPDDDSHGWPAIATVTLLWDLEENA